jgi:hypothetical protein
MHQTVKDVMTVGFLASFAALAFYAKAHADEPIGPPPPGSYVTINQPMIQCDTSDMIKAIADAKLQNDSAMAAKIDEFAKVIDQQNEPSCVFGKLQFPVAVGDSVALPDLKFGDTEVKAWDILVGNARGSWHVLYVMPKTPDKDNSI